MKAARLVVLGATGDLTGRYLLSALCELSATRRLADDFDIVGVAHEQWDDDRFRAYASQRLERHASGLDRSVRDALVARLRYVPGDATEAATLRTAMGGMPGPVVVYLALPPSVFSPAVAALAAAGLGRDDRIVVEKPFGTDRASARELNDELARHFPEAAVFRIDHFLGKQTVQNIVGPLRDMVQNHLLQLLCLAAMERPDGLGEQPLRNAKTKALQAVRSLSPEEVGLHSVRARYTAGEVGGRHVPNYVAEPGVEPGGGTETFAEVTMFVDNDRWRGVPFRLRTGKALGLDRREVRVTFRPVDRLPFGQPDDPGPNVLTLAMDPDRLAADVALNRAGDPFCPDPARWELQLAPQEMSPYARLLVDVMEGDPALYIRGDEAEECWRIVEPVLAAWEQGRAPLRDYPAGSGGPT